MRGRAPRPTAGPAGAMATDAAPSRLRPLAAELRRAAREGAGAPRDFTPQLERPRNPEHGDYATNAALVLGGVLDEPPREIARRIADALDRSAAGVESVEVAGPGFINFRLSDRVVWDALGSVLEADADYGRREAEAPERVNVEFVSANPTGPLHVAHGRGAVLGDAIASLLEWCGHDVTREFYVNDAGRQVRLLGESAEARFRESRGEEAEVPEGGYHGAYVGDLARRVAEEEGEERLLEMDRERRVALFTRRGTEILRAEQEEDLRRFRVRMDRFRAESELHESGAVDRTLEALEEAGLIYEEEGATWLRTSELGDEKDRVVVKSDGEYTYYLPDIAYHLDKRDRGFERAVDVLGSDHHGHVPRMRAALEALGLPPTFFEVVLIQLVSVHRAGREVRMSKRAGDFVALSDLFEETGVDVARYFFLMRRAEVPLQFDLDLALDTTEKNPLYKVQYAHARMCSVFDKAGVDRERVEASVEELRRLETDAEREVGKGVLRFPEVVGSAAADRAPYQVCTYLEELAGTVNAWYHEGNRDPSLRIVADVPARPARLALARAVQITLRNGLRLLGLEAPDQMIRDEEET